MHFFLYQGVSSPVPVHSSGAVTTGTSSTARRPKQTNQRQTNEQDDKRTNDATNKRTNKTNERTRTTRQTNQDRQQKPCNAAHTPYSRSLEGQARVQCLGFARGLLVFFSIPGRFVTSPGSLVRCRDDRNQQHGTTPKTNQPTNQRQTNEQDDKRTNDATNKRTNMSLYATI